MGITHSKVVVAGDRGKSEDWNADHVISDDLMPKSQATKIVAAYNSIDKTRADYVCNGINDDVEIQAAIDSLPAQGGSVYLKEGNYSISASIIIAINNVTLRSAGPAVNIVWSGDFNAIRIISVNNFTIYDCQFDGTDKSKANCFALHFDHSKSNHVSNCWFKNCKYGIEFIGFCDDSEATFCLFDNCYYGIYNELSNSSRVESSKFRGCERGITIKWTNDAQIIGNSILGNPDYAILLHGSTGIIINGNDCISTIGTSQTYGIILQGNSSECIINNNYVGYAINENILIQDGTKNTICGNVVTYAGKDEAVTRSGILVKTNENIIANNICYANTKHQIEIEAGSYNIVLGNNCRSGTILDNGTNTEIAHNVVS